MKNIITKAQEHQKTLESLMEAAKKQQAVNHKLITEIVALHQKHRLKKNYETSDALRDILSAVGIKIIMGTAGYEYDKIPEALKGRRHEDTWQWTD